MARVKLSGKGIREMLLSAEVQEELNRRAAVIADRAGDGYEYGPHRWTTRGRASVITATPDAIADNARNQTLARLL